MRSPRAAALRAPHNPRGGWPGREPPQTSLGCAATGCDEPPTASYSFAALQRPVQFQGGLHGFACAAAIPGVVVGARQPVPASPVVRVAVQFSTDRVEQGIGRVTLD